MQIYASQYLFDWDALEDSPSLRTVQEFFEADEQLLHSL